MKIQALIALLAIVVAIATASIAASEVTDGTWQIAGSIDGLVDPTGITFDGTWIWATEQHAGGSDVPLYRIDPATLTIEDTIYVDIPDCCVQGLAWDGRYIWISGDGYTIYRFDPQNSGLVQTCVRPSNPQALGLAADGATIYATGWYGNTANCDLMVLNPSDCSFCARAKLASVTAYGLAWTGSDFLVCMREAGDPTTVTTLFKYSAAGEMLLRFEKFDFNGYDVAWDGEFAWVCVYGWQGERDGRILKLRLESGEPVEAYLDIKPGSCPNPFNAKKKSKQWASENRDEGGVLPVALLGTPAFDVSDVNVSTLSLEGVAPIRFNCEDVATPTELEDGCACTTAGPDGCVDLTLKFSRVEIASALGNVSAGETIPLTLTGELNDGTPFDAVDCVVIVGGKPGLPAVTGEDAILNAPTPNPFNPTTRISYVLHKNAFVELAVYDANGGLVERLVAKNQSAGEHVFNWSARGLPSGVYFCRLVVGDDALTRKLILIK
jgi:hypothetical protein